VRHLAAIHQQPLAHRFGQYKADVQIQEHVDRVEGACVQALSSTSDAQRPTQQISDGQLEGSSG